MCILKHATSTFFLLPFFLFFFGVKNQWNQCNHGIFFSFFYLCNLPNVAAMTTITELAKHVRGTGSIPRTSKLENKSDSLEPLSLSLLCLRWWRIIGRYVWAKVWMAPCHLVFLYRGFAERKYPSATIITPVTENSSGTELRTARGRCWGVWGILKRFILPGWLW